MNPENTTRTAIAFFLIIFIGSIASSIGGGVFGAVIAMISPELIGNLFAPEAKAHLTSYSFAVGMIWGLFIGAAASSFACGLAAILKIIKIRLDYKNQKG